MSRVGNTAVFTAVFGGYDHLKIAASKEEGVDYYCFTDDPEMETGYYRRIVVPMEPGLSAKAMNLKIRTLGHPALESYGYTLYHDGSISVKPGVSVAKLVADELSGDSFWKMFHHSQRTLLRHEALAIVRLHKEPYWRTLATVAMMLATGYPLNPPTLSMTGVILRKPQDERTRRLGSEWWKAFQRFPSKRDQMTFDSVCVKCGLKVNYFDGSMFDNNYVDWHTMHKAPETSMRFPLARLIREGTGLLKSYTISAVFRIAG